MSSKIGRAAGLATGIAAGITAARLRRADPPGADLGARLLRSGYTAIAEDRSARGGATTYTSRLMGRRALVLGDAAGARVFYDESLAVRRGAVPPPLARLLFGKGAVHGMDGEAHRDRKSLFTGALHPGQVASCADLVEAQLHHRVSRWGSDPVVVHDELVRAYGAAILGWVGVDRDDAAHESLAESYARIVDGFGFSMPAYPRAWAARRRTDTWAANLIGDVRAGRTDAGEDTFLARVAATPLPDHTAAVELGNVVRPTIAVSWLGTFAVAALVEHAEATRQRIADDDVLRRSFVEEVRRVTPFVPALTARAARDVSHAGQHVKAGDRLVLDVRRINEDPDVYDDPSQFRADRFVDFRPDPYELVPQGGGHLSGHRCPGESMTVQLLERTVCVLAPMALSVLSELRAPLDRIPTLPEDGLRVR